MGRILSKCRTFSLCFSRFALLGNIVSLSVEKLDNFKDGVASFLVLYSVRLHGATTLFEELVSKEKDEADLSVF